MGRYIDRCHYRILYDTRHGNNLALGIRMYPHMLHMRLGGVLPIVCPNIRPFLAPNKAFEPPLYCAFWGHPTENYCCRASYDIRLGGGLVIECRRDLRVLLMKLCNV